MTRDLVRLGLDIGGSKILGALVDGDGSVVAQARETTAPGPDGVLATALAVIERLGKGEVPPFIGIGIPGIVDRARGAVKHGVNLGLGGDWFPLGDELAAALRGRRGAEAVEVVVENDLNAATWGAHVLSGADDLAYISLGTGLAAGFVLAGVLRRGAHGAAGEIGHVPVDPAGEPCSCGQRGCLELIASGSALAAAWPTEPGVEPAGALFAAAEAGDEKAVQVRDRFVGAVAAAVRMAALSVDPETIVIGGGVTNLGSPLREAVVAALQAQASASPFLASLELADRLRLVPPRVPLGAIGAAMIGDAR